MRRICVLMVALILLSIVPAQAGESKAGLYYAAGLYEEAAAAAASAGGARDLALAARALNAKAYLAADRKAARRMADRAFEHAKTALEKDPNEIEAHLQAAIALALRGANMAGFRAFLLNLPGRARRHIDAALAREPENAWALSTSAAWRLEVFRRGGDSLYGADPERGYREFLKARALAPDNIAISYECALRILASGRPEWRADALACLAAAEAGAPHTDFERKVKARAAALAGAVRAGPEKQAAYIAAQP